MSNLAVFNEGALPNAGDLARSLKEAAKSIASSGPQLLKMSKNNGSWSYGADHAQIKDDDLWAVNPTSFVHGYVAWANGEVVGEKMFSATTPMPPVPDDPVPAAKKGWQVQAGLSLKGISGNVQDVEARYFAVSVGGRREISKLMTAIINRASVNPDFIVPVVKLKHTSYMHKNKEHGEVFTPVFEIVDFIGFNGEKAASASLEDASSTEASRRRRSE